MDREYERLDREVKRLERLLKEEQAAELRAKREAELKTVKQAREERARAIAKARAEAEAKKLAEVEAPFLEALALFRKKAYEPAYERFIKLYFERKESIPVAFYTGRSAFETKRYEIAAGAYQQVLSIEPDHQRAKLELARTYFVMGLHQEAKALFEEVGRGDMLPDEVRKNIGAYLDAIEDLQKRHHFSGQLIAGLGQDSNVNQGNDYIVRGLDELGFTPGNPARSDSFVSLASFNTHRYDFGNPGFWQWQSDLLIFTNQYSAETQNSLMLAGLQTGPSGEVAGGRLKLPIGYDKVWVDSDDFMSVLSLGAGYERSLNKQNLGRAAFKWFDRQNADSANADLDSTGYELALDWQNLSADQSRVITAGFMMVGESPKQGNRPEAESTALGVRGGLTYLIKPWSYGAMAQLKQVDYANDFIELAADGNGNLAPSGTVSRSDTQIGLSFFGTRSLKENLTLSGQLGWLKNDSSYDLYDYDKTTLQINLSWGWSH